jgi:hypothetical protein
MSAESTYDQQRTAVPWISILVASIISIVVSMIANLIVRSIGLAVFDISDDFEPLATVGPVIMASFMYGIIATIAFTITRYFARDIRRTWLIVAGIGLVVSFIPPLLQLTLENSSAAAVVLLMIMHLVAAAVFVPLMLRFAGED